MNKIARSCYLEGWSLNPAGLPLRWVLTEVPLQGRQPLATDDRGYVLHAYLQDPVALYATIRLAAPQQDWAAIGMDWPDPTRADCEFGLVNVFVAAAEQALFMGWARGTVNVPLSPRSDNALRFYYRAAPPDRQSAGPTFLFDKDPEFDPRHAAMLRRRILAVLRAHHTEGMPANDFLRQVGVSRAVAAPQVEWLRENGLVAGSLGEQEPDIERLWITAHGVEEVTAAQPTRLAP